MGTQEYVMNIYPQLAALVKRLTRITFYDEARVRTPYAVRNGPDADGRSTDLQSDRLGSIPTVSTKPLLNLVIHYFTTVLKKIA